MRLVFIGSAELACSCLERLLAGGTDTVAGVVTQPNRPKGRALHPAPCPVRALAAAHGLPVLIPEKVNAPESLAAIRQLAPELIVVTAYGQLLKAELLGLPPRGCVNVHASLLPQYRGAAPIQWAIARGETRTGVTTMLMDAGLDTGDILDQAEEPIRPDDTGATLHDRLARLGADLLARTLDALRQGTSRRRPQDPAAASRAPRLKKSDGRLDWTRPALELHNRVRGFQPWPGCFFQLPQNPPVPVKVLKTRVLPGAGPPGLVLAAGGAGPVIAAGDQALGLLELQPAGGRAMPGAAFLRGHPLPPGARLA